VETWGLGGVNNETKIAGLIIDFASVRAGLIQKSIISPAWTDNRFFRQYLSRLAPWVVHFGTREISASFYFTGSILIRRNIYTVIFRFILIKNLGLGLRARVRAFC